MRRVFYARTDRLQASTGRTVQTTGPGKVIAFGKDYSETSRESCACCRAASTGPLTGAADRRQPACGPGDTVKIKRPGLTPVEVTIAGVVDLPDADALFQGVGSAAQAAPQAPPDNVVILPRAEWHQLFDPQGAARPDSTRTQLHVRLDHAALPAQPMAAYTHVTGAAHNLEARVAGQALVANNLGARLDAVRGDSLYATCCSCSLAYPVWRIAAP